MLPVTISVLIFSFAVETLQSIHIVERLEMEDISIVKTVIGTSFSLLDMVMCVTGIMVVLVVEKFWLKKDLIANPAVTGLRQQ